MTQASVPSQPLVIADRLGFERPRRSQRAQMYEFADQLDRLKYWLRVADGTQEHETIRKVPSYD